MYKKKRERTCWEKVPLHKQRRGNGRIRKKGERANFHEKQWEKE